MFTFFIVLMAGACGQLAQAQSGLDDYQAHKAIAKPDCVQALKKSQQVGFNPDFYIDIRYPMEALRVRNPEFEKNGFVGWLPVDQATGYYDGHFPGQPIMPGKEIVDSLFQLALYQRATEARSATTVNMHTAANKNTISLISVIHKARFLDRVRPEQLYLDLQVQSENDIYKGVASSSNQTPMAEAEFTIREFEIMSGLSRPDAELTQKPLYDTEAVQKTLPHGLEALRVDQVVQHQFFEDKIRGSEVHTELLVHEGLSYLIVLNENQLLMSPKDLLEGMAQTAGLINVGRIQPSPKPPLTIFAGVNNMSFLKPLFMNKGERLLLKMSAVVKGCRTHDGITACIFNLKATVDDDVVAEGQISAMLVSQP